MSDLTYARIDYIFYLFTLTRDEAEVYEFVLFLLDCAKEKLAECDVFSIAFWGVPAVPLAYFKSDCKMFGKSQN